MIHKAAMVFPSNWCYSEDRDLGGLSGPARYSTEKTYGMLEIVTVLLSEFVPLRDLILSAKILPDEIVAESRSQCGKRCINSNCSCSEGE